MYKRAGFLPFHHLLQIVFSQISNSPVSNMIYPAGNGALMLGILAVSLLPLAGAQQPGSILPADPLPFFALIGASAENLNTVPVEGQSFSKAWRIRTAKTAVNPWDIYIEGRPVVRADEGDVLLATFWIRTLQPADSPGYTRFVVQRSREPYTKSAEWSVAAGPEWQKVEVPFTMAESDEPAGFSVQFWVSYGPQEIEVGGLSIRNYGPGISYRDLPLQEYPYAGHRPDASWRISAAERIEKIRKGDLTIVVRDEDGRPVPNASVRVKMKRHAFGFGTAVAAEGITDNTRDGDNYRKFIPMLFNKAILENDLKWPEWERNRERALNAVKWLRSQDIAEVRGHNLVWPNWQHLPQDLQSLQGNPDALRARIGNHITDEVTAMKGQVAEWDVVNEPVTNRALQAILGEAEMAEWYRRARAADPAAKLYVNEFSILAAGGNNIPHQNGFFDVVRYLDSLGAPVDGIGIQGHFDANLTPPEKVLQILDRVAQFGKEIQVTEFDVDIADEQAQAAYMRDFLTAVFSHPAVKSFSMWGFWEGRHWCPRAAMIRRDWSLKPNGEVWKDLVFKQWWTNVRSTTNENGVLHIRGFLGDYEIEVSFQGQTHTLPATITTQPAYVRIGKDRPGSISPAGVVNGASYARGPVAPGEIVTIWGSGFGSEAVVSSAYDSDGRLSTIAGDTRVYFDGVPAPVIYSADGRVAAIVPYSVSGATNIQLEFRGTQSNSVRLPVADAAPGIFTYSGGSGQAVAVNNDGSSSFNSPSQPAVKGSLITFYVTGEGRTISPAENGKMPSGPPFPSSAHPISVLFGDAEGAVDFQGLVYPGVTQLNARVPETAPSGEAVPLTVKVAGMSSQPGVTVSIQ
ncbi:MAG: endo-1,4-beta-xylanase [Bryobacteraceae bacterium]